MNNDKVAMISIVNDLCCISFIINGKKNANGLTINPKIIREVIVVIDRS